MSSQGPKVIKTTRQRMLDAGINVFAVELLIKSLVKSPLLERSVRLEFEYRGKEYALTIEETAGEGGREPLGASTDGQQP